MSTSTLGSSARIPKFSLIVPFHNETECIEPLFKEIAAISSKPEALEVIAVDDGSCDDTLTRLECAVEAHPWLRIIHLPYRHGQSAAILNGVREARHDLVVTIDGDGQNDPADAIRLLEHFSNGRHDHSSAPFLLVVGWRRNRHDSWIRKISSRLANGIRGWMLSDHCPDTGCGIKAFRRDDFLAIPTFDHMHRFLPALFNAAGGRVINIMVAHRPRMAGRSKYGINNRLWVGLVDLFAVRWLVKRHRRLVTNQDAG